MVVVVVSAVASGRLVPWVGRLRWLELTSRCGGGCGGGGYDVANQIPDCCRGSCCCDVEQRRLAIATKLPFWLLLLLLLLLTMIVGAFAVVTMVVVAADSARGTHHCAPSCGIL